MERDFGYIVYKLFCPLALFPLCPLAGPSQHDARREKRKFRLSSKTINLQIRLYLSVGKTGETFVFQFSSFACLPNSQVVV
jgi:hypothetical protein